MGRLMDRLIVECRNCKHKHIPHRLSARFHNEEAKRIQLWKCKECGHFWQDSVLSRNINIEALYLLHHVSFHMVRSQVNDPHGRGICLAR